MLSFLIVLIFVYLFISAAAILGISLIGISIDPTVQASFLDMAGMNTILASITLILFPLIDNLSFIKIVKVFMWIVLIGIVKALLIDIYAFSFKLYALQTLIDALLLSIAPLTAQKMLKPLSKAFMH